MCEEYQLKECFLLFLLAHSDSEKEVFVVSRINIKVNAKCAETIQKEGQLILDKLLPKSRKELFFYEITSLPLRNLYDEALNNIHYAASCQRVGRCMRLAIINMKTWIGGIVLGSPFPNIDARDRFLGLKRYVVNFKERGLKSPWARENHAYWSRLQRIVNHARTFVFPAFQGKGFGVNAHKLLLTEGIKLWENKYHDKVAAIDTLCDHGDSKLFLANGWTLVGETKGYCSNPKAIFSQRTNEEKPFKNNVALMKNPHNCKWIVWVKLINPTLISL